MKWSLECARNVYVQTELCIQDQGIPESARQNLKTARITAAVAQLLYAADRSGDAAESLAIAERVFRIATVQALLPDAKRGAKIAIAARTGHEAVHGTSADKAARWKAMADDYHRALASGNNKTGARSLVAEKHGVSTRTVQRAVRKS